MTTRSTYLLGRGVDHVPESGRLNPAPRRPGRGARWPSAAVSAHNRHFLRVANRPGLRPRRLGEGVARGAEHGHEDLSLPLPAGLAVDHTGTVCPP